ncbi:MAG: hypothetical protein M1286_03785 [Candidatus Marsarchaeota archaeon]|nr:hypothetical protein [Candidatus Marsarchaeota archaeon]
MAGDAAKLKKAPFVHLKLSDAARVDWFGMSTQLCGYTLARESYSYMQKGFAEVQRMEFIFVRQHLDLKQLHHEL